MQTQTTPHPVLDFIASLLCVFDVDWQEDFPDDGYRDLWGRAPLVGEPLFFDDEADVALPRRGNILMIPKTVRKKAAGR